MVVFPALFSSPMAHMLSSHCCLCVQGVWVRIAAHDSNDFAATAIEWSTITYDCPTAADGTNIAVPLHLTDKGSGYPYFSHCVSGPQRELPQLSAHRSLSGVSDITPPPAMQPHDSQADMAALNTRDMLTEDHRSDSQSPQQFQAVHTASGSTQAVATAVRASGFESKEAASTLRFSYAWDLSQPDTELPHSLIWSGFDLDSDWIDTSHLAFKEGLYQMHMKLEPPELRFKVGLMHQPSLFTALFDSAVGLHATHFRFEEEGLARVKVMVQVPAGVSNGSVWLEVSPVAEMQPAPGAALITVRVREAAEYDSQATAEAQAAAHQHAGTPAAAQVRTRRLAMYSSQQQDTGARGFPTGWLLVLVVAVSAAFVLMRQR